VAGVEGAETVGAGADGALGVDSCCLGSVVFFFVVAFFAVAF